MTLHYAEPPVFQRDASYDSEAECDICRSYLDMREEPYVRMDDGTILCRQCAQRCPTCIEWITDPKAAINLRCYATGKVEPWHPQCAADEWMERLIAAGDEAGLFDRLKLNGAKRLPYPEEIDEAQVATLYECYMRHPTVFRKEPPCK